MLLSVRDASDKELASGLTNVEGQYRVQYPAQKPGAKVKVTYEKLGFTPRPAKRSVADSKSPQEPVLLLREGADDGYYNAVAGALQTMAPAKLQESATAVAALPQADRERVLRSLKRAPAADVVRAIDVAVADASIVSRVKAAIHEDASLKASDINVETFKGQVQLSGFVLSRDATSKAGDLARGVKGVASVKNELRTK